MMTRLMSRTASFGVQRAWLAVVLLTAASGCESFPGASFEKRVEELTWSVKVMAEQPRWQEELLFDWEVFSDPELDKMEDSLSMLGW